MAASKTKRLLYFLTELEKGNEVFKDKYITKFDISERTMKEDVSELKADLSELRPYMVVKYARKSASYYAEYEKGYGNLQYSQAALLSKILFESRALRKDEVIDIIENLVERAVEDKERNRLKSLVEAELKSYEELPFYQDKDKSLLPLISVIFDALEAKRPLAFTYRQKDGNVEDRKALPISLIFDNHYFYCISYKLNDDLTCDYSYADIRYFRVDRIQTIHKSVEGLDFKLSKEEEERLITDEQARYHAFSMLSGKDWVRITFDYTGKFRDLLESKIPKLEVLEESQQGDLNKVRYSIETFSLLGFQKYIRRFDGDVVFLTIERIQKP